MAESWECALAQSRAWSWASARANTISSNKMSNHAAGLKPSSRDQNGDQEIARWYLCNPIIIGPLLITRSVIWQCLFSIFLAGVHATNSCPEETTSELAFYHYRESCNPISSRCSSIYPSRIAPNQPHLHCKRILRVNYEMLKTWFPFPAILMVLVFFKKWIFFYFSLNPR